MAERWWNTTHTFHIADREVNITPHGFHRMTDLRCDRTLINLEGELGTQLGIDLLRMRYTIEKISYFHIEADYRPFPQVTFDDYFKMAFLLYLLGAYLFTNRGKWCL